MLRLNQTTTDIDIAQALEGEEGTFLAQRSGQCFVAITQRGHSLVSLRPVGPAVAPQQLTPNDPWFITKISNSTDVQGYRDRERERERETTSRI